jgi:hypothetical protein
MPNWLQKISSGVTDTAKKQNLPAILRAGAVSTARKAEAVKKLPNASIIYGIAAGVLGVVGIYFLFTGRWFTGCMVLFLAACFLGFALHFIKHAS